LPANFAEDSRLGAVALSIRALPEKVRGGYEYRQVLIGKYRAIYRIAENQVYIVRARHQRQKPLTVFED
jgi:plasmid stabilization system protein ParE